MRSAAKRSLLNFSAGPLGFSLRRCRLRALSSFPNTFADSSASAHFSRSGGCEWRAALLRASCRRALGHISSGICTALVQKTTPRKATYGQALLTPSPAIVALGELVAPMALRLWAGLGAPRANLWVPHRKRGSDRRHWPASCLGHGRSGLSIRL